MPTLAAVSDSRLKVCSVSMSMPTTKSKRNGIFVRRRLAELAKLTELRAIMPSPYFPFLSPTEDPDPEIEFPVHGCTMPYIPCVMKGLDSLWLQRSIENVIAAQLREEGIDAIDAHFGYPTGAACVEVGRRLRIPTFITIRGVEQRQVKQPKIAFQLLQGLADTAGVIAVSHSLKRDMVEAGIDHDHIEVIPNAIDSAVFRPGDREEARKSLGIELGIPVVVAVGSLIPRKGFHDLVPAFSQVRRDFPDAQLIIVGESTRYARTYPKKLKQQISDLHLGDSILLTGAVNPNDVPKYLHAADVFTLPSYEEGCCNGVLEALACGLPVVVTRAGDNAEYVKDDVNGYLVEYGSSDALNHCIGKALSKRWCADEISSPILQRGWENVAAEVLTFFDKQLQRSPSRLGKGTHSQ